MTGIAVIGMSGRFPGAADLSRFWDDLVAGAERITRFTEAELADAGVPAAHYRDPAFVPAAGVLADPGGFDADFFGVTPAEAELTDPQHRVLLECAWHALEHAGYPPPAAADTRVGVFAGTSAGRYRVERIEGSARLSRDSHPLQVAIGNDTDMLALRLSYKLGLTGPSVTVQTACSSSLVAVHLAGQSLLLGESDLTLAGGVAVRFLDPEGYRYEDGGILAADGHCRPFDAAATGTVSGDGAGVVVLKRLEDALADCDHIHAVILGSAVNNDGGDKAGFTAPSPRGQTAVIAEALAVAGVDASTIDYIEAHGTATQLGDLIEVRALAEAFADAGNGDTCLLGSVKSNIGHLDAAAGVAGLIKAVLALEHRHIPPTVHVRTPNPRLELDTTRFRVNGDGGPWPDRGRPPRAAVSSFGIGGTNAHVVLQAAPAPAPRSRSQRRWQVLPVSAATQTALDAATAALAAHLPHSGADLADVAYTLQVGRAALAHRWAVVCRDRGEAVAALRAAGPVRTSAAAPDASVSAVFMFPGQGSQYPGMGADLYAAEPVFRAALDECAGLLRPNLGWDVREAAFATDANAADGLRRTLYTQPAVFCVDYALAQLLMAWGIAPAAMIGHSLGELVAACLAGVFTLPDVLRVVAARARLVQELPPGCMLAVSLPEEEVAALVNGNGTVAAVNAPGACVVAGTADQIAAARRLLLERRGAACRELRTSHAFHTAMMDPALPALRRVLADVQLAAPRVPFLSNVYGDWITEGQATDPEYWVSHVRRPVRFAAGLAALLADEPDAVLVEVGPGGVLSGLASAQPGRPEAVTVMAHPSDAGAGPSGDHRAVLAGVAELWRRGTAVDWAALHRDDQPRRVPLPVYPFERRTYLLPRPDRTAEGAGAGRREPSRWCYLPAWHDAPVSARPQPGGKPARWLVLEDAGGLGGRLAAELRRAGHPVVTVQAHDGYARTDDDVFLVDPQRPDQIARVVAELRRDGRQPDRVLHAWCLGTETSGDAVRRFAAAQDAGPHTLVALAQALTEADGGPVQVVVLTDDLADVPGTPVRRPERATVIGAATVLTQEYAALRVRCVDVTLSAAEPPVGTLLAELAACDVPDGLVAYRGGRRLCRGFVPVALDPAEPAVAWRAGDGYLVTGVEDPVGLAFAGHLAESGARLVLVIAPGGDTERLKKLTADRPGEVTVVTADLADPDQARHAVHTARDRLGHIAGVVHARDTRAAGLAALKTRDQINDALAGRVRATMLLDELLAGDDPEFFLIASGATGIVGGFGQLENCAAAAFLDAFAHARTAAGRYTATIDVAQWRWDDWHERQMAGLAEVAEQYRRVREESGIGAADGVAVARAVLGRRLPQVIVSAVDFQDVVAGRDTLTTTAFMESLKKADDGEDWDPAETWPDDEIARSVAEIWRDVLGASPIGPADDFYQLGGNSLFAVQIVSRLRERHGDVPMSVVFEAPTVPGVAAAIRAQRLESVGLDELDALLREVETLSPEEVQARLRGDQ